MNKLFLILIFEMSLFISSKKQIRIKEAKCLMQVMIDELKQEEGKDSEVLEFEEIVDKVNSGEEKALNNFKFITLLS